MEFSLSPCSLPPSFPTPQVVPPGSAQPSPASPAPESKQSGLISLTRKALNSACWAVVMAANAMPERSSASQRGNQEKAAMDPIRRAIVSICVDIVQPAQADEHTVLQAIHSKL